MTDNYCLIDLLIKSPLYLSFMDCVVSFFNLVWWVINIINSYLINSYFINLSLIVKIF